MFNKYRSQQFKFYNDHRKLLEEKKEVIIGLEKHFAEELQKIIEKNIDRIREEYNEASYLFPFWQNYPPEERGRKPKGDQFPWIEVGEHVIGSKIRRLFESKYSVFDYGLPTGADERFVLKGELVQRVTSGLTDSCWLFVDIKSVGPRDDFPHAVLSHNQVSGDGLWIRDGEGLKNTVISAKGKRTEHEFHCTLPPIYILSDGTMAPVVTIIVKPVYRMLSLGKGELKTGQPLDRIGIITVPNGILLGGKEGYLRKYPGLFFPGKDDKEKDPLKVRARISFDLLKKIADWRVKYILAQ